MEFAKLKLAMQRQFQTMCANNAPLFRVVATGDELWETYLNAFPVGSNPLFKTRTEHDCSCCRHFIKQMGGVVAIVNNDLVSLWDIQVDEPAYQVVADTMADLVRQSAINNLFHAPASAIGTDKNLDSELKVYEHFRLHVPAKLVLSSDAVGPKHSDALATHDVFKRGLEEITVDALNTVLELIAEKSLYRGEEHKFVLSEFLKLKCAHQLIVGAYQADLFVWDKVPKIPHAVTRIRNTAIGTLLINLSEGKDINEAVAAFEAMVASQNYKRPTAPVTKAMIENARETLDKLGYMGALARRHATVQDITVNNVLFVDRDVRPNLKANVFDTIVPKTGPVRNLDRVVKIGIEDFIANVVPKISSMEIMVENKHKSNMVSLIAPCDPTSKGMFKWLNNFSWAYAGDFTDSVKERVKKAGGNVTGDLRCSLSWFNTDDLDLHMFEPDGHHIWFSNKGRRSNNGGMLDVDMNIRGETRTPVENICYANRATMREGIYRLAVHSYTKRENVDVGFEVEIEVDGVITNFNYLQAVLYQKMVAVVDIHYSKKNGFTFASNLALTQAVKEIWGIKTQSFQKVQMLMLSPNHWDNQKTGNKHYFFMLDGCKNPESARGFFNEFLSQELDKHRKVLEIVGSKMKTEPSNDQLSGLGFSSTQPNQILCRVKGTINRELKIVF